MSRRVVVTGLGVVSALGVGRDAHWAGLREGRSGIGPISLIPTKGLSIPIAGEAVGFRGEDHFSKAALLLRDRVAQMAVYAGREALTQAGLEIDEALAPRVGVVLGCSMGGMHTMDGGFKSIYGLSKPRVHPFTVPKQMPNAAASHLSMTFGAKGPAWAVSTACASSNHAMGQAFHLVRSGGTDVALTGGCESGLTFGVLKAWEGLRVMAKDSCRPFCATRSGMVQGEGAAVIVIETLARAQARGAPILAEFVGAGMSADAGDIVQPSQDGAARAMRMALNDARLSPDDIDYINAHGTATVANDKTECAAIREVFGDHAHALKVSSTKSMHGHAIGAAGALEMAATVLALHENIAPPTINFREPDPECDLNIVPNVAQEGSINAALSNSFAFGGLNAVVALRAWR